MLEKMKEIVKKNDLCVLATLSEGIPHCSLMSYISDEEGDKIYMVSHKETRKYHNLIRNPLVSLLIDTREESRGKGRNNIRALTINGEFQTIKPAEKDSIRAGFMKELPHLADFLRDPGADIFSIRLKSFQLLDGLKDVFIEELV